MCFSAPASFASAAVLAAIGAASVARSSTGTYRLFAATPLLFAAQQASEGVVWLTISDPSQAMLNRLAVSAFLGLALVVWPIWLSLSLRIDERDQTRRRVLTAMVWFGVAVSVAALVLLTRYRPVAIVAEHSIRYDRAGTTDRARDMLVLLSYLTATVAPLFISTVKFGKTIGVMLVISLVAAAWIERDSITSVWCFFAAILSGLVFVSVGQTQRVQSASLAEA